MTITKSDISKYEEYLINEEKSTATLEKYLRDVKSLAEWLGERELTKSSLLEYKEYLTQKYAPGSVNSAISSLNSYFTYKELYSLRIKTLKIQKQIFSSRERELTKAEYERLLLAAKRSGNDRMYFLMQTVCSCGIRVSELKYITVESIIVGRATINLKGKLRIVIIPRELCKMLKKYAEEKRIIRGSIFITKNGAPLDRSNIWRMMKSLCQIANVPKEKVFPHNLRHLFARTFYTVQKDIVRLADVLGHSNVDTTRIYTMETGETHRKQIQMLGLLQI